MSCVFGENRDIFFPKLNEELHLVSFADIAVRYLTELGYEPFLCSSEDEARYLMYPLLQQKKWPCLFTNSDTTGEKEYEEFFTDLEILDLSRFENFGIIKNNGVYSQEKIDMFSSSINEMKKSRKWNKEMVVDLFFKMITDFEHKETGKYLDSKM
jgi:hypothetical protein